MSAMSVTFATPAERLAGFFDSTQPRETYNDTEIDEIATLLERCNHFGSRCPRIYIILRVIGELDILDRLLNEGFNDQWFPVEPQGLPQFLSQRLKVRILQTQSIVLTKSLDLEKGRHRHFTPGEVLPFEILGRLGSGGYGQVDRIESKTSFHQYALKRIRRRAAFGNNSKEAMRSFLSEIQIVKSLKHKHIIEYIGSYTDKAYLGLVMSPIADTDLNAFLDQTSAYIAASTNIAESSVQRSLKQKLAFEMSATLKKYFGCLTAALTYLHDRSVRHKDIKPQNILVKGGNVILADFGLSREFADDIGSTTSGPAATTPRYSPPEVVAYEKRNTTADIWSLGCVFFEMTGALQGYNTDWVKRYFSNKHGGSTHYYANHEAYKELLKEWEMTWAGPHKIPLQWIRKMVEVNRLSRPTAASVMYMITRDEESQHPPTAFCGICCVPDEESGSEDSLADDFHEQLLATGNNMAHLEGSTTTSETYAAQDASQTHLLSDSSNPDSENDEILHPLSLLNTPAKNSVVSAKPEPNLLQQPFDSSSNLTERGRSNKLNSSEKPRLIRGPRAIPDNSQAYPSTQADILNNTRSRHDQIRDQDSSKEHSFPKDRGIDTTSSNAKDAHRLLSPEPELDYDLKLPLQTAALATKAFVNPSSQPQSEPGIAKGYREVLSRSTSRLGHNLRPRTSKALPEIPITLGMIDWDPGSKSNSRDKPNPGYVFNRSKATSGTEESDLRLDKDDEYWKKHYGPLPSPKMPKMPLELGSNPPHVSNEYLYDSIENEADMAPQHPHSRLGRSLPPTPSPSSELNMIIPASREVTVPKDDHIQEQLPELSSAPAMDSRKATSKESAKELIKPSERRWRYFTRSGHKAIPTTDMSPIPPNVPARKNVRLLGMPLTEYKPYLFTRGPYGKVPTIVFECCAFLKSIGRLNCKSALTLADLDDRRVQALIQEFGRAPHYGKSIDWEFFRANSNDVVFTLQRYLAALPYNLIRTETMQDMLSKDSSRVIAAYIRWYREAPLQEFTMDYAIVMQFFELFTCEKGFRHADIEGIAKKFFNSFFPIGALQKGIYCSDTQRLAFWIENHNKLQRLASNEPLLSWNFEHQLLQKHLESALAR